MSSAGLETQIGLLGLLLMVGAFFSEGAKRLGQSMLLGELLVGVILGPSFLGWLHPSETMSLLMELGLILLLIETGIETNWRSIVKVGGKATLVAITGVTLPWVAGTAFGLLQGLGTMAALMVGATLTATSIGITASTLSELRVLGARESQVILGAAVLDDIVGLGILGIMQSMIVAKSAQSDSGGAFWIPLFSLGLLLAVYFLVKKLQQQGILPRLNITALGKKITQKLINLADGTSKEQVLIVGLGLLACWAFQSFLGISMALAAFGFGLLLRERHDDPEFKPVIRDFSAFATVIIPLFFIGIGMQLDLNQFNPFVPAQAQNLVVALVLTVIAIATKAVAGFTVRDKSLNSAFMGMGMVPRGEVGLIFVQVGKSAGVLNPAWSNILIVVVILTTFVAPILLKLTQGNIQPTDPDPDAPATPSDSLHDEVMEHLAEGPHWGTDLEQSKEHEEYYERLLAEKREEAEAAQQASEQSHPQIDPNLNAQEDAAKRTPPPDEGTAP